MSQIFTKEELERTQELLSALEEIKKAKKEGAQLEQKQLDLLAQHNIAESEVNKSLNEQRVILREILGLREKNSTEIQERIDQLNTQKGILEAHKKSFEDLVDLAEVNKEIEASKLAKIEDQYKQGQLTYAQYLQQIRAAKADLEVATEKLDVLNEQADAGTRVGNTLARVLGISQKTHTSFAKDLVLMMFQENSLKKMSAAMGGFAGILDSIGNKGIESLTALFMVAAKLAISIYDVGVNLRMTTGMSADMATEAQNVAKSFVELGYTTDQVQESFSELFTTVSEFSMMTPAARAQIQDLAMAAQKAGVSFGDFSKATQVSGRIMGLSGVAAAENAAQLGHYAASIGMVPSTIIGAMDSVVPSIAAMGKGMGKEMRALTRIQKATGIEMQRLISISDQFDTFEGSAKAVGSLNAMLGGDFVNALDLMMARSPSERFMMLKDALDAAGKSFDTMAYFEKKAIAEAIGFSSVGELAMMMRGEFDLLGETANKTSEDWAKYYREQQQLKDFMSELRTIAIELAPDMVKLAKGFAKFIHWVKQPENIKMMKSMIGVMVGMKFAAWGLAGAQTAAALSSGKWSKVAFVLSLALGALAYILFEKQFASNFLEGMVAFSLAIVVLGRVSDASAASIGRMSVPMLAMGGAMVLMGAGVALATLGISEMISSFAGLGEAAGPAAWAVGALMLGFVLLVGTLAAIAIAAAPAVPLIFMLGAAVGLVGLGIGLAAAGMSLFVGALSELFTNINPLDLAVGIGAMAAALPLLAYAAGIAILPLGGLAGAFLGLAGGVVALTTALGKLEKLEGFPNLQAAIVQKVMAVTVGAGEAGGRAAAAAVVTAGTAARSLPGAPSTHTAAGAGTGNIVVQLDRQGTIDFLGGKPVTYEHLEGRIKQGTGTG